MFSNAIVHGLDLTSRNNEGVRPTSSQGFRPGSSAILPRKRGSARLRPPPRVAPRRAKSYTWRGAAAGTFVEPPFLSGDD